jgi:hypothetical protein
VLVFAHPRSSEGPSPETCRRRSGEWRPAAAARNRRPREVRDPARQALRPGCEELAAQIRKKCRRWKRGPRPKIATVERREASVPPPWDAPRLNKRGPSRAETRDNGNTAPFGAPLAPHGVDGKEKSKTRAQQRAAGTKKTALFDMVNRNDAATHSIPIERAPRRAFWASRRVGIARLWRFHLHRFCGRNAHASMGVGKIAHCHCKIAIAPQAILTYSRKVARSTRPGHRSGTHITERWCSRSSRPHRSNAPAPPRRW